MTSTNITTHDLSVFSDNLVPERVEAMFRQIEGALHNSSAYLIALHGIDETNGQPLVPHAGIQFVFDDQVRVTMLVDVVHEDERGLCDGAVKENRVVPDAYLTVPLLTSGTTGDAMSNYDDPLADEILAFGSDNDAVRAIVEALFGQMDGSLVISDFTIALGPDDDVDVYDDDLPSDSFFAGYAEGR